MPTRNISLTQELDSLVGELVEGGRYENASEVVRAGLRALEREEQEHEARLTTLLRALDDGEASGVAKGDVFAQVRKARKTSDKGRRKIA